MAKEAILVTGCAGLIGSQMCQWIKTNHPEYQIIGIDNLSDGFIDNIPTGVLFYNRDISDPIRDIFDLHDIKYVFHFAARAAESMSGFNRMYFHGNNIVGSANIINCCIEYNVNRLCFASSMSVYGDSPLPFHEGQTPCPVDPYGIGKYAVELDLKAAYLQHGLKYSIFRGHSIYGPKQSLWDAYRNVLGIWMRQALNGDPYTVYGDGEQRRAFTYIDDILPALWMCVADTRTENQTYNFGSDREVSLKEVLNVLKQVTGHTDTVYLPGIFEVHGAYCSHEKAKEQLGLDCPTSLHDGIQKMWEWAKQQPIREVKKWDRFEIQSGLYDMWKT